MRQVGELGEFRLIERLARMLPSAPTVIESIGDDCAVVRANDKVLLLTSDLFIEGVHFNRETLHPEEIGWKAAAAAISDIAAMGGSALFSLVSLACPPSTRVSFVEQLYQGMANVFSQYGGVIVGGDMSRASNGITIDVTVVGEVRGSRCLRRRGALPGDLLAITGYPGLSAAGLDAIQRGLHEPELTQRHRWPRPRLREAQWMCQRLEIHAMLDTSDGLVQDATHLAGAADLGVNIERAKLPVSGVLARHCEQTGLDLQHLMLTGGEDYELAFAMGVDNSEATLNALHNEFRTVVTVVGQFTDEWAGVRVDGEPHPGGGYDHFLNQSD